MDSVDNKTIPITIYNPHSWKRTALVDILLDNSRNIAGMQIYDDRNVEITSQISTEDHENRKHLKFVAEDIPPSGARQYFLKPRIIGSDFHLPEEGLLDGNDYYLENDVLRIIVEEDGTLSIMDKISDSGCVDKINEKEPKLMIMGEELGNGSIWAGDRFFNYMGLYQIQVDADILKCSSLEYKLLEANDFFGKIEVTSTLHNGKGDYFTMQTVVEIEKGDKPTIQLSSKFSPEFIGKSVNILFNTPFHSEVFTHDRVICLWDEDIGHGLAIFTNVQKHLSTILSNGKIQISIPALLSKQNNNNLTFVCGLVPINSFNCTNLSPENNVLFQLAEEFFTPLSWQIS